AVRGEGVSAGGEGGKRADALDVGVDAAGFAAGFELAGAGAGQAQAVGVGVVADAEGAFEGEAVGVELGGVERAGGELEVRWGWRDEGEVVGAAAAAGAA